METNSTPKTDTQPTKGDSSKFVGPMFALALLAMLVICGLALYL